ncbi:efflux RND transporter periplasmic adaptor subunit [Ruegeria sp. SCSIO 43209]|uniref:efflux RND transporter periplasmic adaptor subunit n=1 Tax=Ruegeria sp. SCSIO 43209 TaxID=2793010 RepID=UPI00147C0DC0|nr:efflux RND transporter periplasmic adaptor subunit [Ruegeria sp. SCSIO 43209]UAB89977.1 efflux RND transporter periplasmic adaptor subunit [Ruegeria sp. SCSIO 43209]
MRLISFVNAILVIVALYFLVFERDALFAFAGRGDEPSETATEASESVQSPDSIGVVVLRSTAREIGSAVQLRGQTKANRQVEVLAETISTVLSEPKRKGAFVEAGDLLCELDPGTRPASLAEAMAAKLEAESRVPEAEARLEEAHARLAEAEINLKAARKLSETGFGSETRRISSEAEMSTAEAGIKSAEAGLEATQAGIEAATAAVAAAQREIDRLTISAPFKGLLESDTAELGSLMQPGSLCATVIQLDPIKLVGFVPESEVNRIIVGSMATAQLVTGLQVEGRVTFLSRSADETTRTFEVEITVPNPELLIRDGQTANIQIAAEGVKAHLLPQSALTLNNEGELGVRTVVADNVVDFVPIRLLRDTADGVWVGGLPETADIIVIGQEFVTRGVTVAPTYREASQ